jgi:hypothetical protein
MRLGRDIVEVFEAIPDRIEVSGHAPTWQVTGGSFESVLSFANEAFDRPVVVARQDRRRWWPRVTLTVTTDPALAAEAPPLEDLAHPEPQPQPEPEPAAQAAPPPTPPPEAVSELPEPVEPGDTRVRLEDMFAYQEELRASAAERRMPSQHRRR